MKRSLTLVIAFLAILWPMSVFASIEPCDGDYGYTDWTYYDDDWLIWNFTPTGGDSIGTSEPWWGSFLDSTKVYLDCPDPCTYTEHTISNFFGGNEWMPNVGGQGLTFRQMAAGQGGTVVAIDYGNTIRMFDGMSQTWKTISGSFPTASSILAGDADHIFALQDGYIYRYDRTTGAWNQFGGWTNYVQLATTGNALFARDSSGVIWATTWDTPSFEKWGLTTSGYYPQPPSGMTQFSIASNGASATIYGGTAAYAIASGTLYRMVLGYDWRWEAVPTPFTPVEIQAGPNAALALDSTGKVWTLTSLYTSYEWYDPVTHWHTILGATWNNSTQLPSGTTHIAVGGPSDVWAFGQTQSVQRFFPNNTVDIWEAVSENYVGNLPQSTPSGLDFRQSGSMNVTERCQGWGTHTLVDSFWDRFFKTAYTKLHWLKPVYPATDYCYTKDRTLELCDYKTEAWCTPETTPPIFRPDGVTDFKNPPPLGYWDTGGLCVRVLSTDPWWCPTIRIYVLSNNYALQTPNPARAACTAR